MRITLNGLVVASDDQWLYDWFDIEAFSPGVVRRALEDNPEGEDLELEINSGGGSVFAGFEIYSLLREDVNRRLERKARQKEAEKELWGEE